MFFRNECKKTKTFFSFRENREYKVVFKLILDAKGNSNIAMKVYHRYLLDKKTVCTKFACHFLEPKMSDYINVNEKNYDYCEKTFPLSSSSEGMYNEVKQRPDLWGMFWVYFIKRNMKLISHDKMLDDFGNKNLFGLFYFVLLQKLSTLEYNKNLPSAHIDGDYIIKNDKARELIEKHLLEDINVITNGIKSNDVKDLHKKLFNKVSDYLICAGGRKHLNKVAKEFTKTTEKVQTAKGARCIYVNKKGVQYVRLDGEYVRYKK